MQVIRNYLEAARVPAPAMRRLRVLAFDPSLATRLETASFNEITVEVPWEEPRAGPGRRVPRGRRRRPGERRLLPPGRPRRPAPARAGRPRAVGVEPAVSPADGLRGRDDHDPALRAGARPRSRSGRTGECRHDDGEYGEQFVRRLRIYPHALRDRNAYYSPAKKALLFGYFPVDVEGRRQHAGHARLHLPLARHHRARDDARAARRRASALQRADEPRRPRLPRGVRRHRRALPALLLSGRAREPDPPHARRSRQREPARPARAAVRPGHRPRRGAARRAGRRTRRPGRGSRASRIRTRSTRRSAPHARGAILVAAVFRASC